MCVPDVFARPERLLVADLHRRSPFFQRAALSSLTTGHALERSSAAATNCLFQKRSEKRTGEELSFKAGGVNHVGPICFYSHLSFSSIRSMNAANCSLPIEALARMYLEKFARRKHPQARCSFQHGATLCICVVFVCAPGLSNCAPSPHRTPTIRINRIGGHV